MRAFKLIPLLVLLSLLAQPSAAQRIEDMPGYFDLSRLEKLMNRETTLEVNVKGALLRMAAEAARVEDETLAEMLLKLRAIQVRGYSVDRATAKAISDPIGAFATELADRGWDRVVRTRDGDESVEMLVMDPSGERVEGMMVFVVSQGDNATIFVNIVGQIDPEDIGRIGQRFRIRVLENL